MHLEVLPTTEFICLVLLQFITDLTASIDEADFKECGILMKFLQSHSPEKKGSSYKVKGTYEELENLGVNLSAVKHHFCLGSHGQIYQQDEQATTQFNSVDVSAAVMIYIEQKCTEELKKVGGNQFLIEAQPNLRTLHNKSSSTVQVTFRPSRNYTSPVHAHFVRQRFITFYQRTASDLQVISLPVGPNDHQDLKRRFPYIFFEPVHNKSEVIGYGLFVHIAKMKASLLYNTQCLSKRAMNTNLAETSSRRNSHLSPLQSNNPEEDFCLICRELIKITESETLDCKHSFCRNCLKKAFEYKPVCPTCGKVYGILTGTQPDTGIMNVTKDSSSLPGYDQYGTIVIHYYIPSGIQKVRPLLQDSKL